MFNDVDKPLNMVYDKQLSAPSNYQRHRAISAINPRVCSSTAVEPSAPSSHAVLPTAVIPPLLCGSVLASMKRFYHERGYILYCKTHLDRCWKRKRRSAGEESGELISFLCSTIPSPLWRTYRDFIRRKTD